MSKENEEFLEGVFEEQDIRNTWNKFEPELFYDDETDELRAGDVVLEENFLGVGAIGKTENQESEAMEKEDFLKELFDGEADKLEDKRYG